MASTRELSPDGRSGDGGKPNAKPAHPSPRGYSPVCTGLRPVLGIPELRSALSRKLKAENGLDYSVNEICVANGAKQAIANAILSIIDHGDEVVMLAPFSRLAFAMM